MTTATITQMKCACSSCLCIVDLSSALEKNGQYFCSNGCAEGHKNGEGCSVDGCGCHK